jgi:hypothetical protein
MLTFWFPVLAVSRAALALTSGALKRSRRVLWKDLRLSSLSRQVLKGLLWWLGNVTGTSGPHNFSTGRQIARRHRYIEVDLPSFVPPWSSFRTVLAANFSPSLLGGAMNPKMMQQLVLLWGSGKSSKVSSLHFSAPQATERQTLHRN